MSYPEERMSLLSSELKRLDIGIAALSEVGDRIAARSRWMVTPTIGLVALMVTMPKELLQLCPIS